MQKLPMDFAVRGLLSQTWMIKSYTWVLKNSALGGAKSINFTGAHREISRSPGGPVRHCLGESTHDTQSHSHVGWRWRGAVSDTIVSRTSLVTRVMRLPSSCTKFLHWSPHAPRVLYSSLEDTGTVRSFWQ